MSYRTEFGDYAVEYGGIDYEGAVVLDIGADYGTTAQFFLSRGAAHVHMSERRAEWIPKLHAYAAEEPRVSVLPPLSEDGAEKLLLDIGPDVVKVDCEGCERMLLGLPDHVLSGPRAWVMETHAKKLYEGFVGRFRALGYTVFTIKEWPHNPPERHRKVIWATR